MLVEWPGGVHAGAPRPALTWSAVPSRWPGFRRE